MSTGHINFVLSNDISFPLGRYTIDDLSKKGKKQLKTIVKQIKTAKTRHSGNLQNKIMYVRLKVTAYTDSVGFRKGSPLIKILSAGIKKMPPGWKERRKALNKERSRRRAYAIHFMI